MRRALDQARQENPEATYSTIAGQFGPILESLIDERALLAFASDHGFVLSKRLVDAEIASLPQTRGLDGKFSEQAYQAFLQQQQMTDADIRRLIEVAMTQRLVLAPAAVDARVPVGVARPYASMLLEAREGQMALVPTARIPRRTRTRPTATSNPIYAQNRQRYMVAEQRVLRIAKIGAGIGCGRRPDRSRNRGLLQGQPGDIRRQRNAGDQPGGRPGQEAGRRDRCACPVRGDLCRGRGTRGPFAPKTSASARRPAHEFSGLAGDAVANAAFAAAKGAIVGPVRSDLGWHVIKIDDIRGATGQEPRPGA